jgi:pimeloyl-ACP methyl ester carboxylesterase
LFLVPGVGAATGTSSMFGFDPEALGFACEQTAYFSYAGQGAGAPQRDAVCPITTGAPYRAEDTRRPVEELAATFRDQLAELEPPVVVVAHSQGAWVAAAGIDRTLAPDVAAAVLISAFPRHERGYVLDGPGRGMVGTDGVELLTSVLRALDATSFHPRAPLAREHLGTRGAIRELMEHGIPPGLRVATVTSAFDLPVMGGEWRLDGAVDTCPVYVHHGGLPFSAAAQAQIRRFLDGGEQDPCGWWRRWPAMAATAFSVPGG